MLSHTEIINPFIVRINEMLFSIERCRPITKNCKKEKICFTVLIKNDYTGNELRDTLRHNDAALIRSRR